ncbi:hypothetical protein ACFL49_00385 [Candidatus Omnitrophota bacterium]
MIRKIAIVIISCVFMLNASMAFSRPPSSIELHYDQENSLLSIDVKHISRKVHKHYIRRVLLFKNDELVETFVFVKQQKPTGFLLEVSIDLLAGEEIRVKMICSKAGRKEQILIVDQEK